MLITNYYMFIKIGIAVPMSSTGMLEKKRMHHDLVAGDVERFLAEGGQITQVEERTLSRLTVITSLLVKRGESIAAEYPANMLKPPERRS